MSQPVSPLAALALLLPSVPRRPRRAARRDAPAAPRQRRSPTPGRRQPKRRIPITTSAIVVTGVRRTRRGRARRRVGARRGRPHPRGPRRASARRLPSQPGVSATSFGPTASRAGPARPVGRPRPGPHRRHRQPRPVLVRPRPCDRDQPADRRADRGAARPVGLAVRLVGDRRRGQRHRHAHPAPHVPDGPVGVNAAGQLWHARPTSARSTSASTCRSAAISSLHADGSYSKSDDLRTGGHLLSDDLREQALASPDPDIRALADLKGKLPNTAAKIDRWRGRRRLCRRRLEHRRVGHPPQFADTACRSAFRSIPTSRPKRRRSTRSQTRCDVRVEVPLGGFFSRVRAARRLSPNIATTRSRTPARSARASSARAAKAASSWSRPSGRAGAAPAASNISNRNARIRGEEKFLPDSRQKQAGLFTLQTLVRGPLRARSRRAGSNSASSPPKPTSSSGPPAHVARFHDLVRARSAASMNSSPGWRAGLSLSQQRARAVDRRIVRQRPARRQPVVRGRQPRPRPRAQHCRSKLSAAPHDRPGAPDRQPLLQPLLQLHLPGADRRDRGRSAGVRIPPGQGQLLRLRAAGATPSSARRSGIDWGGELVGRRGPRDDQAISARRRRSRRSACSAR